MKTVRMFFYLVSFVLVSSILLFNSCGGSGESVPTAENAGYGPIALFVTDRDSSSGGFRQAIATIERVELVDTGTGGACDALAVPTTVDAAGLGAVVQLVSISDCAAGVYDRMRIELDKSAQLTSAPPGTASPVTSLCSFASFLDETNTAHALQCSGPVCTMDVSVTVHAPVSQKTRLVLDFRLPDSAVTDFGDPLACSLGVAVAPLSGWNPGAPGRPEAAIGLVSGLTGSTLSFTLVRGASLFAVDYSAAAGRQPGLERLLQFAETNSLRVKVVSPGIDIAGETIRASDVFVKVAGVSPDLNTGDQPLHLTFRDAQSDTDNAVIAIDYSSAETVGMPAEHGWVTARLYGYDGAHFLASRIIVEPAGMVGDG